MTSSRSILVSIFGLVFLAACNQQQELEPGASPVFFIVKDISEKFQSHPSATGLSSTYNEVEVTVDVACRSKQPVRFDQLQSVFYAGSKPMSAVSHILTKDDSVMAYYALEGQVEPPGVPAERMFEIRYGEGTRFVIASANSNFGLLVPGTDRKILVNLKRQGQTAYGPFTIQIPWPK